MFSVLALHRLPLQSHRRPTVLPIAASRRVRLFSHTIAAWPYLKFAHFRFANINLFVIGLCSAFCDSSVSVFCFCIFLYIYREHISGNCSNDLCIFFFFVRMIYVYKFMQKYTVCEFHALKNRVSFVICHFNTSKSTRNGKLLFCFSTHTSDRKPIILLFTREQIPISFCFECQY